MFVIHYTDEAADNLKDLTANIRKQILDKIDKQLTKQPTIETRNRKIIKGLKLPWEHEEPIWELRAGTYRIFYDVDEGGNRVTVRAIRYKPPHKATEEIL